MSTPNRDLLESLRRSHEDLGTLRVFQPDDPERAVVAAGAPWFMALFGRDSLLTSLMMLPVDTNLAIGTLKTLAEHQGRKLDAQSEEEPGKVLHEMRFGPAVNLSLGGRREYYGSVDATPLFVMALGELYKWRGLDDDVLGLVPAADRALEWITQYGDSDNDGFVEYRRKTDHGLVNQGWKDSWDGINFADGQLAEPPIALAEVQGYVYAAFLARARLANALGESAVERDCTERAQALRRRFNEAFWLPEHGWFAVGLDATKRPIDALTSNIGHCLWTGIVDADKAPQVAAHLLSPAMFSGWGIRTLANTMAAYNPLSYHNGSVWPHDTAICASGLMRNGLVAEAQKVADAILRASRFFGHRLPELFGGFDRDQFAAPVPYPTACSPQAWAAAAPLELLRTMLRFEPDIPAAQIVCAPVVPDRYLPLRVENLIVGEKTLSVSVTDTGTSFTGTATQSYDISSDHHDEETATCG